MFWFVLEILGLIVGVILLALGILLRRIGSPDPQLAALHRKNAAELLADGDIVTASRALECASQADMGEHLSRRLSSRPLLIAGFLFAVVSGVSLFY